MGNSAVFFAGIAIAFVAIVLVLWQRAASAKSEKAQLERRISELTTELATVRVELAKLLADSATRAGFESLATEREKMIGQLITELDGLRSDLRAKVAVESQNASRIKELETELKNERQNMAEKITLLEGAKQTLAHQFQALAGEILEAKSRTFSETNKTELGTLLNPLREQIRDFREKVEKAQSDSNTGVTKLETLIGTLGGLNQQLSEEARNLTTALRGSSKAQGDWGEFILRDLLEKAGLHEGEQFTFQQTFPNADVGEDGKVRSPRTDVIVMMPGGRHLVIDSKVSLNAYTDSVNAETTEQRGAALEEHIKSMRKHVGDLAKSGYDDLPGISAPDFVVMFVPIEPAFLTAIQNDSTLWADAYHQKILLVGPTTLLYVIRIVHVLWESEIQARNVEEVMQRGSSLYEKFVGFINDLEDLGRSINGANLSYEAAKRKLSEGPDNLVKQVEKLRQLGVKRKLKRGSKQRVTKSIPIELLSAAGVFDSESAEGEAASSENSELSGELEGDSEDIV